MKKSVLLFFFFVFGACSHMQTKEIPPSEIGPNDLILDVRTPEEHQELSLAQPHWRVTLDELNAQQFVKEHKLDGSKPLHLICRSGHRAKEAAEKFKKAGFNNVVVIQGGIIEAEKAGIKMKKQP